VRETAQKPAGARDAIRALVTDWNIPLHGYRSKGLVSVPPDMVLHEVNSLLEAKDISAAPVVGQSGELLGIVSSTDLLRASNTTNAWLVRDVMKREVVTASNEETLRDAAKKMVDHRIHRLVIVEGARAVGVVSTRDAMRAVLSYRVEIPVEHVATAPVETVDIGDDIDTAIARLRVANVHGLVVVDGEWPVGVFTHREAIKARALPPDIRKTPVEQIMSYETICMNAKTPLYRVAGHAISMNVRRVLVVSNRHLVGIATGFDLVRFMTTDG
jgi:CBS domain-containing protein